MTLESEAILADLTPAQREAAGVIDGAVLVLAGPGSGKTRVITRRIAHLIDNGVQPWRILALTFTNKAAKEMRDRVEVLLGGDFARRRGLTVATFHSYCASLLRRWPIEAGLEPGFSIYDASDQRAVMKEAIEECGYDSTNFSPATAQGVVSKAKNDLFDAEEFAGEASDFFSRSMAKIYRAYQAQLRANNAVDFDDLLFLVVRLLRDHPEILRSAQERCQYLLVDEYQDTNHAQFVIAHALAGARGNLFVVGDPDQSIYGWRGADISNILEFERYFPDARVIPLGENFRSTGHIVAAAAGVITHNVMRRHKDLSTSLEAGLRPRVLRCADEHHESECAAEFLLEAAREGVAWRRMAVLYRMNAFSRVVEDELRRRGIPYVIARGTAFWDRKEVRDVVAYLRAIANPSDEASLRRIVNVPPRGIGETTVRRLQALSLDAGIPFGVALERAGEFAKALGRSAAAVASFGRMLASWRERAATLPPGELAPLVADVLRESGLDAQGGNRLGEEDLDAKQNRGEIVSAASEWRMSEDPSILEGSEDPEALEGEALEGSDAHQPTALDALRSFLTSIALVSDQDVVDADRGAVTLMTLHAAKGLEFDTVVMIGLEQGALPHARADEKPEGVEEERRLCFVGMTRAERRLLLTGAAWRVVRGNRTPTAPSLFLSELPLAHVEQEDLSASGDRSDIIYDEPEEGVPASRLFPIGCTVRHRLFGIGTVEQVVDRGRRSSARVHFRTVGVKTLVLSFAHLERVVR